MKRQIVEDTLFEKHYTGIRRYINISDIPQEVLKPENFIDIEKEHYYSDSSNDAYTIVRVFTKREQNDEEYEKYKQFWEQKKEESLQERKRLYEKLKKEFEDDND